MGGNRGSGDGRIALANLPVLMREPGVAAASRFHRGRAQLANIRSSACPVACTGVLPHKRSGD